MKIFSTQLQGIFSKIINQEGQNIEDGARLLAQAVIGEGKINVHGFGEMESIMIEATKGAEPLLSAEKLFQNNKSAQVNEIDRVLLVSRFSTDPEVIQLAEELQEKGIPTVAISATTANSPKALEQIVDIHIDCKLVKALIPDEDGKRYGFPSIMTALFAYHHLAFTVKEMVNEYE